MAFNSSRHDRRQQTTPLGARQHQKCLKFFFSLFCCCYSLLLRRCHPNDYPVTIRLLILIVIANRLPFFGHSFPSYAIASDSFSYSPLGRSPNRNCATVCCPNFFHFLINSPHFFFFSFYYSQFPRSLVGSFRFLSFLNKFYRWQSNELNFILFLHPFFSPYCYKLERPERM